MVSFLYHTHSPSIDEMSLSSLTLLLLLSVVVGGVVSDPKFSRDDFPSDFVFGAGASAYQVEGAVAEDGRTPSTWDTFTQQGNMKDKSTADTTCDGYHKYKEDVKLMSDLGLEAYRLSISWSRLLPYGRGPINPKGLEYYNNLINELINHGIEPHVTIFHEDLPQIIEDEYDGWLSPKIIEDYTAYAEVCFREFGDRVYHWTTFNEPNIMSLASYLRGEWPPRRCSPPACKDGNSSVEPYTAIHHILLAHASAVAVYRENYQAKKKGLVGINLFAPWCPSLTNSTADTEAAQRAMDFYIGWVVNPVMFGDYPNILKKNAGSRLPSFTEHESKLLKGSSDFIGLNHYATYNIQDKPRSTSMTVPGDFDTDMNVKISIAGTNQEIPQGPFMLKSLPYKPSSLKDLLEYIKEKYGNPPVYIQENGHGEPYNETLNDIDRARYIRGYIESTLDAIRSGSNTRGYFVWSFLDVFEFLTGYEERYGMVHVKFEDKEFTRRPKLSAQWYSSFIKKNALAMTKIENDITRKQLHFSH